MNALDTSDRATAGEEPARRVDVVIVNWNGGQLIRECVESVVQYGAIVDRIIVVDNASTDGSIALLPREARVDIVENAANLGFARACNVGAARGAAPYILFLNPDARMIDRSLDRLVDFMDSPQADDIGISGPRLIGDNGETQRSCANFTNASTYLGGAFGLTDKLPRIFTPLLATFDYSKSRYVDQAIGAYFLIRRLAFEDLGGFDDRFFVYFEEVDLALRAKKASWKSYYFADAVAYHKGGGVSEQFKAGRLFYTLRSRLLYAAKHFSVPALFVTVVASLLLEPVGRIARAAARRSPEEARDTIKAYGMVWRDMRNILFGMRQGRQRDA